MSFLQNVVVVSDTSPLIYLEKAGQIPLLEKMFGHVLIPESVRNELFGKTPEHEAEARKILKSDCFSVLPVRNTESVRYYMTEMGLHRGESEAITLARECNANVLIMDESAARSVVSEEGLPVYLMGAMGIVRQGYESGLISENDLRHVVDVWRNDPGIYIAEKYLKYLEDYPGLLKTTGTRATERPVLLNSAADKAPVSGKTKDNGRTR